MPTTITLEGVGRGARRPGTWLQAIKTTLGPRGRLAGADSRGQWLGDAWSDDAAGAPQSNAVADFTTSAVGWGVLAFAVGTAAIRGYGAVKKLVK